MHQTPTSRFVCGLYLVSLPSRVSKCACILRFDVTSTMTLSCFQLIVWLRVPTTRPSMPCVLVIMQAPLKLRRWELLRMVPVAASLAHLLVEWHHLLSRQVVLDNRRFLKYRYASVWSHPVIVHWLDGTIWHDTMLFATQVDAKGRVLQAESQQVGQSKACSTLRCPGKPSTKTLSRRRYVLLHTGWPPPLPQRLRHVKKHIYQC